MEQADTRFAQDELVSFASSSRMKNDVFVTLPIRVGIVVIGLLCGLVSLADASEAITRRGIVEVAQWPAAGTAPVVSTDTSFVPPPVDASIASLDADPACSCGVTDWFVSSRGAQQDWCEAGGRCLQVFVRRNYGCLERSSMAEMLSELRPDVPTVVFTHGSFVKFSDTVCESKATSRWLRSCICGRSIQTIFFTWPSDENVRYLPGSVRELTRRAEFNSFYLAQLLGMLPCDASVGGRLTVMGHSHGGLMTAAAMHLLGGGLVQGRSSRSRLRWRPNVVLAAPALDRDWLTPKTRSRTLIALNQVCDRGRYDRAMCVTNSMLILRNKHDLALKVYPLRRPFVKQALGKAGLSRRDKDRLGAAACRIKEVDVSRQLGCKHIWPYYLQHQSIACTVGRYIL